MIRGHAPAALAEALGAADLLVIGAQAAARAAPGGLKLHALAPLLAHSVLLLADGHPPRRPAVVLKTGSGLVARTIAAGLRMAPRDARALDVVLAGDGAADALAESVRRQLAPRGIAARLSRAAADSGGAIAAAAHVAGGDLVVLAGDLACIAAEDADALVRRMHRPVLIVR
jgi:hypothetical protein